MSKYDKYEVSEEMAQTLEEQRDERYEKVRDRYRIAVVVLLIAIILLAIRVGGGNQPIVLAPDYALVPEETHATPSNDNQEKLEAAENGGAVAMIYSDQVGYDMASDTLSLSFTNPSSSTAAVILQVIITDGNGNEYLLAESGALKPGYSVDTLDSDKSEDVGLAQGVYKGLLRVLFYNADTGERAIVNSDIVVEITVQ